MARHDGQRDNSHNSHNSHNSNNTTDREKAEIFFAECGCSEFDFYRSQPDPQSMARRQIELPGAASPADLGLGDLETQASSLLPRRGARRSSRTSLMTCRMWCQSGCKNSTC